jgi:hypothetical protein
MFPFIFATWNNGISDMIVFSDGENIFLFNGAQDLKLDADEAVRLINRARAFDVSLTEYGKAFAGA